MKVKRIKRIGNPRYAKQTIVDNNDITPNDEHATFYEVYKNGYIIIGVSNNNHNVKNSSIGKFFSIPFDWHDSNLDSGIWKVEELTKEEAITGTDMKKYLLYKYESDNTFERGIFAYDTEQSSKESIKYLPLCNVNILDKDRLGKWTSSWNIERARMSVYTTEITEDEAFLEMI